MALGGGEAVTLHWVPSSSSGGGDPSPLTTKGDLYAYSEVLGDTRLPGGEPGQVLVPDADEPIGLRWADLHAAGWTLVESVSQTGFDDTTDAGAILTTCRWGIDGSGDPYFDSAGVTSGEEAALWLTDDCEFKLVPLCPTDEVLYPGAGDLTAANAASPLSITTFAAGNDEVVHPSVVDAGPVGWNGHRYWLAATPYPNTDNTKENPSIWCSDDGETWSVPSGGTNPVVAQPPSGFNSDCDLVLRGGTMHLFWRVYDTANTGQEEQIHLATSSDGTTWTDLGAVLTNDDTVRRPVSPSVLVDSDGTWRMWTVDILPASASHVVQMWTAPDPEGPWSGPTNTDMAPPSGDELWHLDVGLVDGTYHVVLLVADPDAFGVVGTSLRYGTSTDGETWTMQATALLTGSAGGWDDELYRAAMTPDGDGGWVLWYGSANTPDWLVGMTTAIYA